MADSPTALQKAVAFLARREHSRHELRNKLGQRDFEAAEIEQALEELYENGLQSDERFAEAFVQSRIARGYGLMRIIAELRQRGIEENIAARVIDDVMSEAEANWFDLAYTCYVKKYGTTQPADYNESGKRLRFLQQRGFSAEQCQQALKRAQ